MASTNEGPIAILAGNGRLPLELADGLVAKGEQVHLFGIGGEADEEISRFDHTRLGWLEAGRLFRELKARNIKRVMLAGGVTSRPELDFKKMDWGTLRTMPDILGAILGGDNAILSSIISILERRGYSVPGIADVLPEILVSAGSNTKARLRAADRDRLTLGSEVTRALGHFDIGQAAIVVGKRAVAVEGVEGTDAMLERVAGLRQEGRLGAKSGGVLVKWCKPGQDQRADLPTIGPQTIHNVHRAGLDGIGVEADRTIMLQRAETLALAGQFGIFIMGMRANASTP